VRSEDEQQPPVGAAEKAGHRLSDQLEKQTTEISDQLEKQTNAIIEALLTHPQEVRGQAQNLTRKVADRADAIARRLQLPDEDRQIIRRAAILRDVGKAGVSDRILTKSGPLTAVEYAEIRARMIPEEDSEDSESVRAAINIAHHHHERFDGQGYPDRLKGEEIPLGSRILAVAEAYETMLVDVPWRPARAPREALGELRAEADTQFDARVVDALAGSLDTSLEDEGPRTEDEGL